MTELSDEKKEEIYWRRVHTRLLRRQSSMLSWLMTPPADPVRRVGIEGGKPQPGNPNPRGLVADMMDGLLDGFGGLRVAGSGPWETIDSNAVNETIGRTSDYFVDLGETLLFAFSGASERAGIKVTLMVDGNKLAHPVSLFGTSALNYVDVRRSGIVMIRVERLDGDDGEPFDFALCKSEDLG
ncbi:MAG: hypothetical protein RIT81_37275 [Deltaproteobacteria bacterium]